MAYEQNILQRKHPSFSCMQCTGILVSTNLLYICTCTIPLFQYCYLTTCNNLCHQCMSCATKEWISFKQNLYTIPFSQFSLSVGSKSLLSIEKLHPLAPSSPNLGSPLSQKLSRIMVLSVSSADFNRSGQHMFSSIMAWNAATAFSLCPACFRNEHSRTKISAKICRKWLPVFTNLTKHLKI